MIGNLLEFIGNGATGSAAGHDCMTAVLMRRQSSTQGMVLLSAQPTKPLVADLPPPYDHCHAIMYCCRPSISNCAISGAFESDTLMYCCSQHFQTAVQADMCVSSPCMCASIYHLAQQQEGYILYNI